jgi:hypothetical protein
MSYAKLGDLEISSIAEIIEYDEKKRLVYRAEGGFTVVCSNTIQSLGSRNEVRVIAMIGLAPRLASPDLNREIYSNLDSVYTIFEKIAYTLS